MPAAINPYAPPKTHVEDVVATNSEAEAVRLEHIKRETSIRSIGVLYYISGGLVAFAGIGTLMAMAVVVPAANLARSAVLAVGALCLAVAGLQFALGSGIRGLRPWARNIVVVFACLGVLGFPLGTLINGYILYLLLSKEGKRIFESDYPDIVAATPEVKYRTSTVAWVVLAVLALIFFGLLILGMTSGMARWMR